MDISSNNVAITQPLIAASPYGREIENDDMETGLALQQNPGAKHSYVVSSSAIPVNLAFVGVCVGIVCQLAGIGGSVICYQLVFYEIDTSKKTWYIYLLFGTTLWVLHTIAAVFGARHVIISLLTHRIASETGETVTDLMKRVNDNNEVEEDAKGCDDILGMDYDFMCGCLIGTSVVCTLTDGFAISLFNNAWAGPGKFVFWFRTLFTVISVVAMRVFRPNLQACRQKALSRTM